MLSVGHAPGYMCGSEPHSGYAPDASPQPLNQPPGLAHECKTVSRCAWFPFAGQGMNLILDGGRASWNSSFPKHAADVLSVTQRVDIAPLKASVLAKQPHLEWAKRVMFKPTKQNLRTPQKKATQGILVSSFRGKPVLVGFAKATGKPALVFPTNL